MQPALSRDVPATAQPPRGRRRWLRALLALAISCTLALACGELLFRAVYGVPLSERLPLMEVRANVRRGYEMLPSSEHYTYMEPVRINNLGLRGADVGPKPDGELRILALGDSTTFGQGVGEADTLPARLEAVLAAQHGPVRVINAGARGFNTQQELALLEDLRTQVTPDIVVLFWFANDLEQLDVGVLAARLKHSGPIVFDFGEPDSDAARRRWNARQLVRKSALVMRLHDLWVDRTYPRPTPDEVAAGFAALERDLVRLAALGEQVGFDVLVAVVPLSESLPDADRGAAHTQRVLAIAQARAVPALDLFEPVERVCRELDELPLIPFDGHYDARANQAMAEHVAAALRRQFPARFAGLK